MGFTVGFTNPSPGSSVPTSFTQTGFWADDGQPPPEPNAQITLNDILVRFGAGTPLLAATINADGTWTRAGSLPAGVHHGDAVTMTVIWDTIFFFPDNPGDSFTQRLDDDMTLVVEIPDEVPPQVTVNAFEDV
jgi:hypothetical protein